MLKSGAEEGCEQPGGFSEEPGGSVARRTHAGLSLIFILPCFLARRIRDNLRCSAAGSCVRHYRKILNSLSCSCIQSRKNEHGCRLLLFSDDLAKEKRTGWLKGRALGGKQPRSTAPADGTRGVQRPEMPPLPEMSAARAGSRGQ